MLHKYYVFGSFAVIVFDVYVNIYALKIDGCQKWRCVVTWWGSGFLMLFLVGLCLWLNYG